jgi:hypothetical protein
VVSRGHVVERPSLQWSLTQFGGTHVSFGSNLRGDPHESSFSYSSSSSLLNYF